MAVPVKRYLRRKKVNDPDSPELFYLRQEPGSFKTHTINSLAREIETTGALSVEDVMHTMKAFVRQLKKKLVEGDKVKVDGLGTFYITFKSEGMETEKDSTVRSIKRVNIRFSVDNTLRLANDTTATTRGGDNNVKFYIRGESDGTSSGNSGDDGDDDDDGGFVDPIG